MTGNRQHKLKLTIKSNDYGQLRFEADRVYQFEKGILGMQDFKDYALFPIEDSPFSVLHTIDEQISFILVPAIEVIDEYGFEIDQELVDLLGLQRVEDVAVFLIVNMQENDLYVNLRAPILLAPASRKACQFIITNRDYPIRYLLTKKEGTHASP
ncbi:flagellar assembly protein FliW [Paenibacillus sp. FSL K6-2524]|uniref:flagellar assembly protein FliW n=1 Tax=Paenibacillus sp. FSL K6-2524 TaxID=2954516 RepID=UPI0030FADA80